MSPAVRTRGPLVTSWTRPDWLRAAGLLGVVALLHVVAFGILFGVVGPAHYRVGSKVFGVGLGVTAYTFGLRHAFDADHIAAIDNTTRKLRADGSRPKSVGFWFSIGHSSVVAALAALVAAGTHLAGTLTSADSTANKTLGITGTVISGGFLYLIGLLNLVALVGIARVFRDMRSGRLDEERLEAHLAARGLFARVLNRFTRSVTRPGQMYLVGLLFGLGFDTATEVALLVLAGAGAAGGLPWWAVMVLPLLFAAGMSLLDTLDGLFMSIAYDWAFLNPVRKVYYNLTVTGLSVLVALLIGSIELVGVLHDNVGWVNPATTWIASIDLNNVGFMIVGLFVATWILAVAYWHVGRVAQRWDQEVAGAES
ncbi:MAG TPA: HoxN/HupN/NixA family nickel/cobalt transporter [Sporichthyaceae bacterium]|jgi:high-affinity nickel-transport protein|nr:HoxN/HupN/NixA family nickel/cobalt transporter [Sporichthyaceae bacterium]